MAGHDSYLVDQGVDKLLIQDHFPEIAVRLLLALGKSPEGWLQLWAV